MKTSFENQLLTLKLVFVNTITSRQKQEVGEITGITMTQLVLNLKRCDKENPKEIL